MGTRFELVLPEDGAPPRLRSLGEAALEEIRTCHEQLNRFSEASLVSHLRRVPPGTPVPLDRDTFDLFADARAVWRASRGAFDPTLGRGMDTVELDGARCTITLRRGGGGLRLDLGGIAKGHALDLAARLLRGHGVTAAFLHGGTSSAVAIGGPPPPGRSHWTVALAGAEAGRRLALRDQALSLSAAGTANPHPTLDPRTGLPVPVPRWVAVIGPSARLADAWSTAALVQGGRPEGLGPEWTVIG